MPLSYYLRTFLGHRFVVQKKYEVELEDLSHEDLEFFLE
jgi:hypothetical protein